MSHSLSAYLDSAPSLDEFASELDRLGLSYRHTVPPSRRWNTPIHVFGLDDVRVVYYQGDPDTSRAMVSTTVRRVDTPLGAVQLRLIAARMLNRWGGELYDPQRRRRVPLN